MKRYRKPCEIMVDSRATTARPSDNASETSEATFTLIDAPAGLTPVGCISNSDYTFPINYVSNFHFNETRMNVRVLEREQQNLQVHKNIETNTY
jgi:hypothetical protein